MGNENSDYRKGYQDARAVFAAASAVGYIGDRDQMHRVAHAMWQAGLTGEEAQRQRPDFLKGDQQRQAGIGRTLQNTQTGGEGGTFIRPTSSSGWENPQAIFDRRKQEAAASTSNAVGGKVQKIHHNGMEGE